MDEQKLNEFIGKILGDLGGAYSIPMVRIGDRLGLYKALKTKPMTIVRITYLNKKDPSVDPGKKHGRWDTYWRMAQISNDGGLTVPSGRSCQLGLSLRWEAP